MTRERQTPEPNCSSRTLLCYLGHGLLENRHGLTKRGRVSKASGTARRNEALNLLGCHRGRRRRRITLGADKDYDLTAFVQELRNLAITPHIAVDGHVRKSRKPRKTAWDGRTMRHAGYAVSQRCRKRMEEVFG